MKARSDFMASGKIRRTAAGRKLAWGGPKSKLMMHQPEKTDFYRKVRSEPTASELQL